MDSPTGRPPSQPEMQHINSLLRTLERAERRRNMTRAPIVSTFDYAEFERRLLEIVGHGGSEAADNERTE